MRYIFTEETPKRVDFMRLRSITGLTPFSEDAVKRGLADTKFGLTVTFEEKVIGMGRVVGDGGCIYFICDIAVDPEHQGQGLGKQIMTRIDAWINQTAAPSAYICLMGDVPEFYEKLGYRRSAPHSYGMMRRK